MKIMGVGGTPLFVGSPAGLVVANVWQSVQE